MIEAMLKREKKNLHRSTICHILNGRKKTKRTRRQKLKAHRRRYELPIPGQRLQLDVKYVPEFVEGFRAFNYVAIDECTRWRFGWAYLDLNPRNTVDFLNRLQKACPFPIHTIQTDNGFEFTYRLVPTAKHVEHPMDEWCKVNGMEHRLIPPGEKELNGKVERSHRIDEQYFYWKAPTDSLDNFNFAYLQWLKIYNHQRLHGGIGYLTPNEKLMERYQTLREDIQHETNEKQRLEFVRQLPKRLTSTQWLPINLKIAA
jgi:transposase InsO family protein